MTDLQNILTNPLMQRAGWSLLHFLWQGAAVAVLLAGTLWLLRRRSSNLRYVVACSALLLMLALPAATMWMVKPPTVVACSSPGDEHVASTNMPIPRGRAWHPTDSRLERSPQGVNSAESHLPSLNQEGGHATAHLQPIDPAHTATPVAAEPVESAEPAKPWRERAGEIVAPALPWVVCGWLIGVLALSAWHVRGWIQVQRLRRVGVRPVGREISEVLARLCNRLGISRAVRAVESALVRVPTVVGCLKPIILLPASALTGLSAEQLEAILAHELAHIRRHDYLINLLQTAAETLLFYHPAAWWVSRRIRAERENCCDDLAVAASGRPLLYARALTAVAKLSQPGARLAVAANGGGGGGKFLTRIRRIVGLPPEGQPTNDASHRGRWLAGAFTLLTVLAITIALTLSCATDKPPAANVEDETVTPQPATKPVIQVKHKGRAELLAFSPDGKVLASWSIYDGIKLSDAHTGRLLRTLKLRGYSANSMAFSADGSLLAAGTNWGVVRLWNVQSLKLQKSLSVCRWSIYAITLSPDGSTLASCAGDGTIQLWNYRTGRRLKTLGKKGERMGAMTFSPDGKVLVTLSRYGRADVWNVATGRKIDMHPGQGVDIPVSVRFCPDGKIVAIGEQGKVRLWRPQSGTPPTTVELPDAINPMKRANSETKPGRGPIFLGSTVFSPDCTLVASVTKDGTIAIWDVRSQTVLQVLAGSRIADLMGGGIDAMAFSPDGRLLATGNRTGKVEVWPVVHVQEPTTQPGADLENLKERIEALAKDLQKKEFDKRTQALWTLEKIVWEYKGKNTAVFAPVVDPLLSMVGWGGIANKNAYAAAEILAKIGAVSRPKLLAALKSPEARLRRAAARILVRIGPKDASLAKAISPLLSDKDKYVRRVACQCLGQLGAAARSVVPLLVKSLENAQPYHVIDGHLALARITGRTQANIEAISPLLKHAKPDVRRFAAETIKQIRTIPQPATQPAGRKSWMRLYQEATDLLYQGARRDKVATRFRAITDFGPYPHFEKRAKELARLLDEMAKEDTKFQEPADVAGLSKEQQIRYLVFKLRDVAARPVMHKGICRVLRPHDAKSKDTAAHRLRKIGKPAVPALIALLKDRRPTRSCTNMMGGGYVLRYSDVALQIIEAISARRFDSRPVRVYLTKVDEQTRNQIITRVDNWWDKNKQRSEAQWIRDSLPKTGFGDTWEGHLRRVQRLIELEGPEAISMLRSRSDWHRGRNLRLNDSHRGKTVSAVVGQDIAVYLKPHPLPGYGRPSGSVEGNAIRIDGGARINLGGLTVFHLLAPKPGTATLTLEYRYMIPSTRPVIKDFIRFVIKPKPAATQPGDRSETQLGETSPLVRVLLDKPDARATTWRESPFFQALVTLARRQKRNERDFIMDYGKGRAEIVRVGDKELIVAIAETVPLSYPGTSAQRIILLDRAGNILDMVSCSINSRYGLIRTVFKDKPDPDGARMVITFPQNHWHNWHRIIYRGKTYAFREDERNQPPEWDRKGLCRIGIKNRRLVVLFPTLWPRAGGSELEFRLVAFKRGSVLENVERYIKELTTRGPKAANSLVDELQWFEIQCEAPKLSVVAKYGGQEYVLLSNVQRQIMLSHSTGPKGKAWGLKRVYLSKDARGQPAVAFVLDADGARLFQTFAETYKNRVLVILVDGKVLSTATIRPVASGQGVIEGNFTKQQARNLVEALKVGMVNDPKSPGSRLLKPATQPEAGWGKPVRGIAARVVLDRPTFKLGEPPVITFELKKATKDAVLPKKIHRGRLGMRTKGHAGMLTEVGDPIPVKDIAAGEVFFRTRIALKGSFAPWINTDHNITVGYVVGYDGPKAIWARSRPVSVRVAVPDLKALDEYVAKCRDRWLVRVANIPPAELKDNPEDFLRPMMGKGKLPGIFFRQDVGYLYGRRVALKHIKASRRVKYVPSKKWWREYPFVIGFEGGYKDTFAAARPATQPAGELEAAIRALSVGGHDHKEYRVIARAGARALMLIDKAIRQKHPKRGIMIWAMIYSKDHMLTTPWLIRVATGKDDVAAKAARKVLVYSPRKEAGDLYVKWLDERVGKGQVIWEMRACEKTRAAGLAKVIKRVVESPASIYEYREALELWRSLVGKPFSKELLETEKSIRKHGIEGRADFDPERVRKATEVLVESQDLEAASAIGLSLATFSQKSNHRAVNQAGFEVLRRLPNEVGKRLIERLLKRFTEPHHISPLKRVAKALSLKRTKQGSGKDIRPKKRPAQAPANRPAMQPVGKADRPHPEIWHKYPHLKEKLDADLGRMKTYLKSLEPGAFAARHPELVKMAKSEDSLQRVRAIKAISALRDKSSLSFVVAAVEKEKTPRRGPRGNLIRGTQCLNSLTKWIYDAYHPARKTPRELAPLLPLFVKMLVEAGDEPNVRGCCFQAIGCLAGPEWLPLVKDLSASRHPAVTHWSAWAVKEIAKRAKPATQPIKKPGWSKLVNDLRARIKAGRYLTKRLGMEVSVSVQNAGKTPVVIDLGAIAFMDWCVLDAENRLVRPGSGRLIDRRSNWRSVIPDQEIGTIVSRSNVNRDGVLDIGTRIWNLKPGKYTLKCDLVVHPNIKRLKPAAWSGKIELPPDEFEVIGEVSDKLLKASVAKVRAAHPAKGEKMWLALADLVRPGMIVRQMKIALPPARSATGEILPYSTSFDGCLFTMHYALDDKFGVEASGIGVMKDLGSDKMVLLSRPHVKRIDQIPLPTTQPATQPAEACSKPGDFICWGWPGSVIARSKMVFVGELVRIDWPDIKPEGYMADSGTGVFKCTVPIRAVKMGQVVRLTVFRHRPRMRVDGSPELAIFGECDVQPGSRWLVCVGGVTSERSEMPDARRIGGMALIQTGKEPILLHAQRAAKILAMSKEKRFAAMAKILRGKKLKNDDIMTDFAMGQIGKVKGWELRAAEVLNAAFLEKSNAKYARGRFIHELSLLNFPDNTNGKAVADKVRHLLLQDALALQNAEEEILMGYICTLRRQFSPWAASGWDMSLLSGKVAERVPVNLKISREIAEHIPAKLNLSYPGEVSKALRVVGKRGKKFTEKQPVHFSSFYSGDYFSNRRRVEEQRTVETLCIELAKAVERLSPATKPAEKSSP